MVLIFGVASLPAVKRICSVIIHSNGWIHYATLKINAE